MSTNLAPLPIHTSDGTISYMEHVGDQWKTPKKIEEYTCTGCVKDFPDSYRVVYKSGPGFGFRASPASILSGNWQTVLTRRISDVFGEVVEHLGPSPFEKELPDLPLAQVHIHILHQDSPSLDEYLSIQLTPLFVTGFNRTEPVRLSMRLYPQQNGWSTINVTYPRISTHILCAVPRDEAIEWARANINEEVRGRLGI